MTDIAEAGLSSHQSEPSSRHKNTSRTCDVNGGVMFLGFSVALLVLKLALQPQVHLASLIVGPEPLILDKDFPAIRNEY